MLDHRLLKTPLFALLIAAGAVLSVPVYAADVDAAGTAAAAATDAEGAADAGDAMDAMGTPDIEYSAKVEDEGKPESKPKPAEIMPLAPKSLLLDIERAGPGYVAVGWRGDVVYSSDGKHWTQAKVPVRAELTAVSFPSKDVGYAVGHDGTIVKTIDGGKTWSLQHWTPQNATPLLDVLCFNTMTCMTTGAYGLYYRTSDGGKTWLRVRNAATAGEWHLSSITQLNSGTLVIAGEMGNVMISTDQGSHWSQVNYPIYDGSFFNALPMGANGVLLLGLRGHLFAVDDVANINAETVHEAKLDTIQSFMGGTVLEDGRLVAVGLNGVIAVGDGHSMQLVENQHGRSLSSAVPGPGGSIIAVGLDGISHIDL